ncbi:MAG: hypothetical protein GKS01_03250 [Alphaproteobacteria bacterium]|nr:hypothetical protein [Alphaproteobacteria bacterium]
MAEANTVQEEDQNTGGQEVVLASRYRILVESPLPNLDLGNARAYVVRDDKSPKEPLFARICPADAVPRLDIFNNLKHMIDANLLRPVECEVVAWPGSVGRRVAIVFRKPDHGVLLPLSEAKINPLQPDELAKTLLGPAVLTLGYMAQRGLSHRAIRADNIYWHGGGRSSILLGDCLSHVPAFLQPVLYETIESGMTPPIGRGVGTIRDDFYSLGVTVLAMAQGCLPLSNYTDEQIIDAKLARGSFAALMNGERPPFGLRELLRGLLSDDPYERWGLEQLEQWLGGGLRSSVQEVRTGAVERSYEFDGKDYTNCRALADAFGRNWAKAGNTILDSGFEKWLRRGVADLSLADRLRKTLSIGGLPDKNKGLDARKVAQACMVMDRHGPVRYQGLIAMPMAMGLMLTDAFFKKDTKAIKRIADSISSGTVSDWYTLQGGAETIIYEAEINQLKQMQHLLKHTAPGYGIERCLYMLNPTYPCLSEILHGHYIQNIRDLMPALEKNVEINGSLPTIVDRHLAAFIACRIKANIDKPLAVLDSAQGDTTAIRLGMLGIFARLQAKYGPDHLPCLTQWLAKELESTVDRVNSKSMRDQMRSRVQSLGSTGSLVDLHNCLNNDKIIRQDESSRKKAVKEFSTAAREISQLESREFQESAQRLGWRIASGISTSISIVTIAFVAMS